MVEVADHGDTRAADSPALSPNQTLVARAGTPSGESEGMLAESELILAGFRPEFDTNLKNLL